MLPKKAPPAWIFLGSYMLVAVITSILLITLQANDTALIMLSVPIIVASSIYPRRVYLVALIILEVLSFLVLYQWRADFRDSFTGIVVIMMATVGISELVQRLNHSRIQTEKNAEARFQSIVENLDEGLIITDHNGVVLYTNVRMADLTGFSRDQIVGTEAYKLMLPPEEWTAARQKMQARIKGVSEHYEREIIRKDGTRLWVTVSGTPLRDSHGNNIGIINAFADISERKAAEAAFAFEHSALTILMDTIPDAIYYKDREGRYIRINRAEANELGVSNPESVIGKSDYDFYDTEVSRQAANDEQQVIKTGISILNKLEEHPQPNGDYVYLSTTKVPVRDSNGNISGIVGMSRDITRQTKTDRALRASEEQMRSLIASIDDLIFSIDLSGRLLFYHQSGKPSLNDTPLTPSQAIVGKPYQKVLPLPLVQKLAVVMNDVTSTLRTKNFDYSLEIDGQEHFFRARISPLIDTNITLVGITAVSTDITQIVESNKRQQRLLQIEKLIQQVTTTFLQSDDLDYALTNTLARFGEYLKVSRAYAFHFRDNERLMDNTHEWHILGIPSEKESLQNIRFEEITPSLIPLFAKEGLLALSSTDKLPDDLVRIFERRKVKSVLLIPFYVDGRLYGFLGFDDTHCSREWLPEEIAAVRTFAHSYSTMLERQTAKEALIQARDSALHSARLKSEFMSNMSHEIRTPMTGLLGMLELLLETELDNLQRELGQTAFESAQSLLRLLNDILDFSKIEAGKVKFESVATDLRGVVTEVKTMMEQSALNKGVVLALSVANNVPARVLCDPTRLRQVLVNLTSNAIKFTAKGSVDIRIWQVSQTEALARLRFEVQDTGIGIAPDQLERIFESFVQADGSITRKFGGTGLGLAISKQLVQLMEGELEVTSMLGQGSTFGFTITLPIVENTAVEASRISIRHKRLSVFGEENTAGYLLSQQLRRWGSTVTEISETKNVIQQLKASLQGGDRIEIIFWDNIPVTAQTVELISQIRLELGESSPQVVLICDKLEQVGNNSSFFDAILQRPFRQSELYDLVISIVSDTDISSSTNVSKYTLPVSQPTRARILIAEDNPINQRLMKSFLEMEGYTVEMAGTGTEVLQVLEHQEFDLILMDIHMPGVDGLETTHCIRNLKSATARSIPIVAVTASILPGETARYLETGMNDVLAKPFSLEQLRAVLDKWVTI